MQEEDHFGRFLAACGRDDPTARVATSDLAEAYSDWQSDEDAPIISASRVAQEMKHRGYVKLEKVTRSDGKRGAGFKGFRLVNVAD